MKTMKKLFDELTKYVVAAIVIAIIGITSVSIGYDVGSTPKGMAHRIEYELENNERETLWGALDYIGDAFRFVCASLKERKGS